jgi:predicted AlkP superfamily phosphohydrolase/phosphomutase
VEVEMGNAGRVRRRSNLVWPEGDGAKSGAGIFWAMVIGGLLGLLNGLAVLRPIAPLRDLTFAQITLVFTLLEGLGAGNLARFLDLHPGSFLLGHGLGGITLGLVMALGISLFPRARRLPSRGHLKLYLALGSGLWLALWGMLALQSLFFELKSPPGIAAAAGVLLASAAIAWALASMLTVVAGRPICLALAGIVLILVLVFLVRPEEKVKVTSAASSSLKVVLIGIDGASWSVIDPLLGRGRMPNLSRLLRGGSRGPLRSLRPTYSPSIWTTIATGVGPSRHGIEDFVIRIPESGAAIPVSSNLRKRKALWNIISDRGRSVGVVGWQVSWPAEEVDGVVISDRIRFKELPRVTYPESLKIVTDSLVTQARERGAADLGGMVNTSVGRQEPQDRLFLSIVQDALTEDRAVNESALYLLSHGQPDLLALYYVGTDRVQHNYWAEFSSRTRRCGSSFVFPSLAASRVERYGSLVESYFEKVDQLLGRIVARCSENTVFLIVSDHGFGPMLSGPARNAYRMNSLLSQAGLLAFRSQSTDIDWNRTLIHDSGNSAYSAHRNLYLNVAGRDARGIIPGASWDKERSRIRSLLLGLRTNTGSRIFSSIEPETKSDPFQQGPDLIARVSSDVTGETILLSGGSSCPVQELLIPTSQTGDHRLDGIVVVSGEGVQAGRKIWDASVMDITPTVLHLLGLPVARDMDGEPLVAVFSGGRGDGSQAVPTVPSYETSSPLLRSTVLPTPADDMIREELRALGYID